jgi:PAS domain S-box-containing protein
MSAGSPQMRILVVDDVAEDRSEMRRLLLKGSDRRYTFIEADSGESCLRAFAQGGEGAPDALLLDYDLLDMRAPEVMEALRHADGGTPCPTLVITVSAELGAGRASIRAGAQDFIEKGSLTPASLTHALDNAIERWEMSGELRERDAELRRRAERDAYSLAFAEATRALGDPQAVKAASARVLGEHLKASRVLFAEVRPDGEVIVECGFVDGVSQIDGAYRLADCGEHLRSEFAAGRIVVIADLQNAPKFTPEQKSAYAALEIAATLGAPLLIDGALVAVLDVQQSQPRQWTPDEVSLVHETAERTLAAVRHARAEARLRASEQQLRVALSAGGMGVWRWDPETGESDGDDAMRALTGFDDAAVKAGWAEAILRHMHADDVAHVLADVSRVLREGGQYTHEFRFHHPSGRTIWLAVRATAVAGADGRPTYVTGVSFDITPRKTVEAALRNSESRLSQLIERMPSFTAVLHGPNHVFELANEPYHALVGRGREIIGKPVMQALPEITDQPFPALIDRVYDSGIAFEAKSMPVKLARGPQAQIEERFIDFAYMPLSDSEGAVNGILIHGVDRTEQVRAERALLESDQRKDEFLATLAHELRNPLAPLRNGLALLRRNVEGTASEATVAMLERQLMHLVHLVDDLLDVSRISLGRITLHVERLTLASKIAQAVEACRPAIDAGRHVVEIEPAAVDFQINGDAIRIVQIISNLLVNAAKYSEPGGRIRISTEREGESVVIRIRDSGVGIAAEVLPTLWSMFAQVRDTLDKAQDGLGIGLSLVKKLVELHGGIAGAESAGVGRGSTFIVRLPIAGALTSQSPQPERAARAIPLPAPGRRLLIVDDNRDGVESMAALFELEGHVTDIALSGPEALERASAFQPDVVLLDIGLPGMDGYEVARRLRADPRFSGLLLLALTGWGSDDDKDKAMSAGFDAHLTKPVDLEAVKALLRRSVPARG